MEIQFSEKDNHLIVAPIGEIDHHNSMSLRTNIEKLFNRGTNKHIIFDFAGVTFMDSSGIGVLIGRYRELKKTGGHVYVINVSPECKPLFGVSGLFRIIPLHDSLDSIFNPPDKNAAKDKTGTKKGARP